MEQKKEIYSAYTEILKEELMAAMGCTEPIALAYAAAIARRELNDLPDKVLVQTSGSIIKNVKSVIVPNTGHLKEFRQQFQRELLQETQIKSWKLLQMFQKMI